MQPHAAGDRFTLGKELGHGGLGRVVEAREKDLDRTVAVKLLRDDLPPELAERFIREARLTARLEHPNIVPVHEFAADGERMMLSMKRVQGRDLGKVLKAVGKGLEPEWTRHRLLGVFQDICQGVAFAHAQGVIHRDLKPANVMIGDFGEVLIVDWGLAKERGTSQFAAAKKPAAAAPADDDAPVMGESATVMRSAEAGLTLEGDLVGTPAYMPPEQAAGRLSELDERSDVYALGAILYEILTQRPPVEGDSIDELLSNAQAGKVTPPSQRLRARPGDVAAEPVPPDLDAICLRALAARKEDRFASATDLHREIQLFLEGVKERERRRRESREHVEAGKRWAASAESMGASAAAADREVRELREKIPRNAPVEQKRPLWDAERALARTREQRLEAIAAAAAEFAKAVEDDPASEEAAEARGAFDYGRVLEAEGRQDREALVVARNALARHDRDGRWARKLDAPGTLALRAFAYGCDCLRPGPLTVETGPEGGVAWRDGRPRPDLPIDDANRPVPRTTLSRPFGHRDGCVRRELAGVRVRIACYEPVDRRLQLRDERDLGLTPLATVALPQGSYRCTLEADGFAPVLLPVRIDRGGAWTQDVTLYPPVDIPDGLVLIPGGPFRFGGIDGESEKPENLRTEDVFAARFPITFAEYAEFLDALPPEEARRRAPRDGDKRFVEERAGHFVPVGDPAFPVAGLSWFDAVAYTSWRSHRDGRRFRLLHEEEFEKGVRGVDARTFPWGNDFDATFANMRDSLDGDPRVVRPGTFAADESPYGLRDTAGNMPAWCWNKIEEPLRFWCALRGGAFDYSGREARAGDRRGFTPETVAKACGIRICCPARME